VVSFLSFSGGAVLPLLPWFFASGRGAVLASIIIGALASILGRSCSDSWVEV
jgi:VIT1/CCC1 family predicted Fe2+/Mn2+ transporter